MKMYSHTSPLWIRLKAPVISGQERGLLIVLLLLRLHLFRVASPNIQAIGGEKCMVHFV